MERLLMGTAVHESEGLRYLQQKHGPALSLWQIEPTTADDAIERGGVWGRIVLESMGIPTKQPVPWEKVLPGSLYAGAVLARLIYFLKPFHISELGAGAPEQCARIWKRYWNTPAGAGTEEEFLKHWRLYLLDLYPF